MSLQRRKPTTEADFFENQIKSFGWKKGGVYLKVKLDQGVGGETLLTLCICNVVGWAAGVLLC